MGCRQCILDLFNIGFFSLLFGFNGSFRHYHVQFHYPRWLSKWLQSPAMHHTHHSYLKKHWDTNMAAVTSIWDRMMGTIYIADKYEENTTGPFRDWYRMIGKKSSPLAEPVTQETLIKS